MIRRGLKEAYRCNICDYDLCIECTKKKSKSSSEGVLRTDSGVKEDIELSNWQYMRRAFTFVKPHLLIICVAMVFLVSTAAANLLIPKYAVVLGLVLILLSFQGKIFDDVINYTKDSSHRDDFKSDIIKFLIISVVMGVLGSLRNLCFQLSARRITNVIRNRLYAAILRQDVRLFFDQLKHEPRKF